MATSNASCCCCFNLPCGTLAIGILLLIIHGLQTIVSIISIIYIDDNARSQQDNTLGVAFYSSLAISGIWFVLDAVLIHGVSFKRPALLLVWLCWGMPISVLATVACAFLVYAATQYVKDTLLYVILASIALASYLLLFYWALIVLQYYKVLRATQRQVAVARAPILAYVQTSPSMYQQPTPAMGNQPTAPAMSYQRPTPAMEWDTMTYQQRGESPARRY